MLRVDALRQTVGVESDPAESETLPRQVRFDILSSRRRRDVLYYLFQQRRPADLRELSERLAAWENDVPVDAVTYKQRSRTYTALRQNHLPKMNDAGVVDFDPRSGAVELTDDAGDLRIYLELVPEEEIPWSTYYLGLGGLSMALTASFWIGLLPFTLAPAWAWLGLMSGLVVVSAFFQRRHNRVMRFGEVVEGRDGVE